MKKIRVAINGFGRIGRSFFKAAHEREEIEIVAINDLGDPENLAYLINYDSAQGSSGLDAHVSEDTTKLLIDGTEVHFFSIKDPGELPWKDLDVDIALEATGFFASFEKSRLHLDAGAKRVVVSAPVKDDPPAGISGATVLMGINEEELKTCDISSNASCTTNAGSPLMHILHGSIGVEKALLQTIHGYTTSQSLVDSPNKKDFRRGRAAAQNIIPTTTGAAIATTKAITDLEGKFDGMAIRVPVIAGSIVDVTFLSKRDTSVEEVNDILRSAAEEERWSSVFTITDEPIVSSDIIGSTYASIADLAFTRVADKNLVKVLAWYDNEVGYTHSPVEHVIRSGGYLI